MEKAIAGCEVIFHVAADYRLWVRDPQEMYRSNVEGTRPFSKPPAKTKSAAWFIHPASRPWASPATAIPPTKIRRFAGGYDRPLQAFEVHGGTGCPRSWPQRNRVVTVNPTTPIGEQDIKPTPTGRIVVDFLKGKFPAYVETGLNLVDVRECALGHIPH